MKQIEIFKTGRHTAMNGRSVDFGEADLLAAAKAYDPAKHEAPLVVGHPKADAPAYGWVKGLDFSEGSLNATPDQVDADFAELVNAGRFKHVSASFYLPDSPSNPAPGSYYLRHVGFLGAQPPAVKGLKAVSFGEAEEGVIEFGDWADRVEAGLFRRLREWIIGKFGLEEADKAVPGWDVDIVQEEAARPDQPEPVPATGGLDYHESTEEEQMKAEELAARETALKQKEADFAEREANLKKQESATRHNEHLSFAEGLVKDGKLLPAQKDAAVALLDFASSQEGVIEFGEGDAKQSGAAADTLRKFLEGQPKIVEFGEVAGGSGKTDAGAEELIADYMEKNDGITYKQAYLAVSKERPELFKE